MNTFTFSIILRTFLPWLRKGSSQLLLRFLHGLRVGADLAPSSWFCAELLLRHKCAGVRAADQGYHESIDHTGQIRIPGLFIDPSRRNNG